MSRYFCGECGGEIVDAVAKDPWTDVPCHEKCLPPIRLTRANFSMLIDALDQYVDNCEDAAAAGEKVPHLNAARAMLEKLNWGRARLAEDAS